MKKLFNLLFVAKENLFYACPLVNRRGIRANSSLHQNLHLIKSPQSRQKTRRKLIPIRQPRKLLLALTLSIIAKTPAKFLHKVVKRHRRLLPAHGAHGANDGVREAGPREMPGHDEIVALAEHLAGEIWGQTLSAMTANEVNTTSGSLW